MKYSLSILAVLAALLAMSTLTMAHSHHDHDDDDHDHEEEVHPNTNCVTNADCHGKCKHNEHAVCSKPENQCHCHVFGNILCKDNSDCVKACSNSDAVCNNNHHCHCFGGDDCHIKYQMVENHTMCMTKSPNATSIEMTDEMRENIVQAHNWRRANVMPAAANMLKMRWSHTLEKLAKKWAEACETRDGLHHDNARFIPGDMFVGQSLASHVINFDVAISTWWSEKMQYKYGMWYRDQAKQELCPHVIVGHYTQMTWDQSYLVGCASALCNGDPIVICNYGPQGNAIPFDRPYEAGETCSKCKKCTEGLCDCGDMYCHGGKLNPTTCQCDCTFGADGFIPTFINSTDCSLDCSGKDLGYCGDEVWNDCNDPWTPKKCPHMCKMCPYAGKNHATSHDKH